MVNWTGFLALSIAVTVSVIVLARSSARALDGEASANIGGRALRWNVVLSQGLVALVVLGGAWAAGIPWTALGFPATPTVGGLSHPLLAGTVLGLVVAGGNVLLERVVDAPALRDAATVRRALAPASIAGWASLLFVVIPIIAVSEELLFRAVLVGALAVGFDLSPWLLVAISSLAFGAAHTAQGTTGVIVTTLFGAILGGAFVLTGDLLVVIVAHALVDVVEFLVHEGPLARRATRP
ncbi:MAG: CPBP family intramembrane glutamic endopeptidase [Halanaeroarchaeum sp.]